MLCCFPFSLCVPWFLYKLSFSKAKLSNDSKLHNFKPSFLSLSCHLFLFFPPRPYFLSALGFGSFGGAAAATLFSAPVNADKLPENDASSAGLFVYSFTC